MKDCLEKRLGLNKPEHVNPKALGVTCPSADRAITSECIDLPSQLVWWPADPHLCDLGHHGRSAEPGEQTARGPGCLPGWVGWCFPITATSFPTAFINGKAEGGIQLFTPPFC